MVKEQGKHFGKKTPVANTKKFPENVQFATVLFRKLLLYLNNHHCLLKIEHLWTTRATYGQVQKNQDYTLPGILLAVRIFIRAENKTSPNTDNSLSTSNKAKFIIIVLVVAKLVSKSLCPWFKSFGSSSDCFKLVYFLATISLFHLLSANLQRFRVALFFKIYPALHERYIDLRYSLNMPIPLQ